MNLQKPSYSEHGILFIATAIAIALDQFLKRWIEATLSLGESLYPISQVEPYLGLTHVQNTGAAFGLLQSGGMFFIIVAAIVTVVIMYYAPRLPKGSNWMRLALGLQLGGALGNVIDRLRQGYVTDMLHFQIPEIGFNWPVSNLADVFILMGVAMLFISTLRGAPIQPVVNPMAEAAQPKIER